MYISIRWRLIASYVSITLLTIAVVGFFGLLGVRRYTELREQGQLQEAAEAIAEQALPIIWPEPSAYQLNQLAQIASFLSDVHVRIMDTDGNILIDSGNPDSLAWLSFQPQQDLVFTQDNPSSWIVGVLSEGSLGITHDRTDFLFPFLDDVPDDASVTIIRRLPGAWGPRFTLEEKRLFERPFREEGLDANSRTGVTSASESADNEAKSNPSEIQVRVPIGDASNPRGFIEVTSENSFRAQALAATQQAFGVAALLALGVAVLLGIIMGRGISRPMISLTESARQMSEGDLSVRAEHNSRDEIGELAVQFNTMAARLQTSFDQLAAERDALRRFITDASHELRTPITALRNFNELLQGQAADDVAARQEFLAESQVQIDRLAWFTTNLLDLSRLDGGISELEMQTFEIDEIVEAAIAGIQAQAADREIQIERQLLSTPAIIYADRQRMQSAIESLLDNAVKYSPPGTSVTIGVKEEGDELLLWVADQGPGVAEHERERIFDRFYRGEARKQPGYGLGLSIVKSIVDAHGGSVTVDSAFGGGARFTIHLPISNQEPLKG